MLRNQYCTQSVFRNFGVHLRQLSGALPKVDFKEPQTAAFGSQEEWENAKPFSEIPRPTKYWLIRNFLPGGKLHGASTFDFVKILKKQYGSVFVLPGVFGRRDIVMTSNPEDYEKVLRTEGIWPMRRGNDFLSHYRTDIRGDFFKDNEGLLATQGAAWAKFRTAVNPVMMQPKIVKVYLDRMDRTSGEFIERIKEIRDPKTLEVPETFVDDIHRWTLESICVVALDRQLGLIRSNQHDIGANELFVHITTFLKGLFQLELGVSLWKYYKTSAYKKGVEALDYIFKYTSEQINEALERFEKVETNVPEVERSVLEKLAKIDKKIAMVMAMDMLMAGVDTTTSTFTGVLLALAKSPEKQQKLRDEIRNILPSKDSNLTVENMKNLPFLRACIKESMRMYPLIPGNFRATGQNIVLSGYQIPKETDVAMNSLTLFRDPTYYPNPHEFIPERWLRTNDDSDSSCPSARTVNPFIFLPFGFGPRSCIGKRIVELELEIGVARFIRNFEIEWNYPVDNVFTSYAVSTPNVPLKFKFTDIKD